MKSNISVYAPLKTQKQYLKLILSRVINRFGDSIDAIAYSLLAYEITGSASMMALVLTVNYLPTVIIQPIAGIVTERLHPARLMAACDLGRGVCVLLEALLYAFGLLSTPLIVLGVLINSTLEALSMPAGVGIVPRILQADLYTPGISLQRTLCSATELIGLACAGAIVSLLGIPFALGIDAATFLISAAIIVTIRPAPLKTRWQTPPSASKTNLVPLHTICEPCLRKSCVFPSFAHCWPWGCPSISWLFLTLYSLRPM